MSQPLKMSLMLSVSISLNAKYSRFLFLAGSLFPELDADSLFVTLKFFEIKKHKDFLLYLGSEIYNH